MPLYNLATLAAAVGIGYLFGSIPFAIVVERWKKVDLRRFGSGNIGASNAFMVAGKFAGVLVLLGDASKGIAAVAVAGAATGVLAATRFTVISSLATVAAAPAFMMLRPWFAPGAGPEPLPFVYAAIILAALGYLRHWDHVERFVQGREPRAADMFREMRARRVKS